MQSSVREIRFRLFSLLLRAFVTVLLLSLLFFLGITGYVLTFRPEIAPFRFPIANSLEGYYLGHGSWEGVETVFATAGDIPIEYSILLDKEDRVILDRGSASAPTIGSTFDRSAAEAAFPLTVHGEVVGTLVFVDMPSATRFGLERAILIPVGLISFILALFLLVVASLLVRRFVNPLADVIYAAGAVANGKLDARISSEGPQDLRSLSESFNEMASSLERNDRERRDMLADIAHELRTPLSVIRGRLEGIMDGIYSADSSQISLALEQTYLLQRLVEDLRLLTLAETRQLPVEKRHVQLDELVQHTVDLFSAEAREKNISLSLETGAGDFWIELDPQRTEQVIGNLIDNALRYIPEGGGIRLILATTPTSIRLSVNDNGPGVAEADLPYLLDRFWRKDKSRARALGGTGLGLAIAKHLIEIQGGSVSAQNLTEGGLQIVVEFKK